MGRKSKRNERRLEITLAFAKVLSQHGYAGATILAVANEAELSAGLLHHHFKNKREMLFELLDYLIQDFKINFQIRSRENPEDDLSNYINTALKLDHRSNTIAVKCWVGILAEGLKDKGLFEKIKRHLDSEILSIGNLSKQKLDSNESSAIFSYILGSLVFGAYAPKRTSGFAADIGKKICDSMI